MQITIKMKRGVRVGDSLLGSVKKIMADSGYGVLEDASVSPTQNIVTKFMPRSGTTVENNALTILKDPSYKIRSVEFDLGDK